MIGLALAMLGMSSGKTSAGEETFIYVDRMPAIRGELQRSLSHEDKANAQMIVQDRFVEDYEHAVIETSVLTLTCIGNPASAAPRTYITAIKYPPKRPKTFALATLHDIFKEVYVEDLTGRIRLYEDVTGPSMITLSERFRPACEPV